MLKTLVHLFRKQRQKERTRSISTSVVDMDIEFDITPKSFNHFKGHQINHTSIHMKVLDIYK